MTFIYVKLPLKMESVHLDFLDYFPSRMIRVEQVVGLPPQRPLQELLVEGLDLRILMGEANRGLLVQLPQSVAQSNTGALEAMVPAEMKRHQKRSPVP